MSESESGQVRTESTTGPSSESTSERPTRDADGAGRRRPQVSMRQVGQAVTLVRGKVADAVWLVAALCAAVLAIGAVLVALGANADNSVVIWFRDGATWLAGPLGTVFEFQKDNGSPDRVKNTVVNWGIAGLVFLVVGRLVQRLIRPSV